MGRDAGGNRSVFGYFIHFGTKWRVNADTHIDPLLRAYAFAGEPFEIAATRVGKSCLALKPNVSAVRPKHVYIYEAT